MGILYRKFQDGGKPDNRTTVTKALSGLEYLYDNFAQDKLGVLTRPKEELGYMKYPAAAIGSVVDFVGNLPASYLQLAQGADGIYSLYKNSDFSKNIREAEDIGEIGEAAMVATPALGGKALVAAVDVPAPGGRSDTRTKKFRKKLLREAEKKAGKGVTKQSAIRANKKLAKEALNKSFKEIDNAPGLGHVLRHSRASSFLTKWPIIGHIIHNGFEEYDRVSEGGEEAYQNKVQQGRKDLEELTSSISNPIKAFSSRVYNYFNTPDEYTYEDPKDHTKTISKKNVKKFQTGGILYKKK